MRIRDLHGSALERLPGFISAMRFETGSENHCDPQLWYLVCYQKIKEILQKNSIVYSKCTQFSKAIIFLEKNNFVDVAFFAYLSILTKKMAFFAYLSILNQKIGFLALGNMIRVVHPGSGSRIQIPIFAYPVSMSQKGTGSRIRNTALYETFQRHEKECGATYLQLNNPDPDPG
jgi:hypothetical protein